MLTVNVLRFVILKVPVLEVIVKPLTVLFVSACDPVRVATVESMATVEVFEPSLFVIVIPVPAVTAPPTVS